MTFKTVKAAAEWLPTFDAIDLRPSSYDVSPMRVTTEKYDQIDLCKTCPASSDCTKQSDDWEKNHCRYKEVYQLLGRYEDCMSYSDALHLRNLMNRGELLAVTQNPEALKAEVHISSDEE